MRYVIFDAVTREIKSAISGPEPVEPNAALCVGDVGEVQFEGALKNYVFVPAEPTRESGATLGEVQRKPREEWDLTAETEAREYQRTLMRFHQLDIREVAGLAVNLMLFAHFRRLADPRTRFQLTFESVKVDVDVRQVEPVPFSAMFQVDDGGQSGYTVPLSRTAISFRLTGHEEFLSKALDRELEKLDEIGRKLFTSQVLKKESLWFGVRVTNHLIDCYRVAYGDWAERPIGIADVLDGAVIVELTDGVRQTMFSGLPASRYTDNATAQVPPDAATRMAHLLSHPAVPFLPVALSELRKSYLYGQYREAVIWAEAIISNLIEEILLAHLPRDSAEYKRLKNNPKKVDSETRRGKYFKRATGKTLREWLEERARQHLSPRELANNIEWLLQVRNQLLHRKRAIKFSEGELATETCIGLVAAIENNPFWGIRYPFEF